jgi:peptide/nickel transport system substrate-binding protein
MRLQALMVLSMLLVILASCNPAQGARSASPPSAGDAQRTTSQRSLVIALAWEPDILEPSRLQVSRESAPLANAFLTLMTPQQEAQPYLAADLPTVENGGWVIHPDGRMETTYRLRTNATWQDGQPVTAHDFVFAHQARLDPAFPAQRLNIERRLERVTAVDDHTLKLEWKGPYRLAGMVAPPDFAPMHRKLLEPLYLEDKAAFIDGPHWREQFIGSGPYRVERWEPGVEVAFRAHDGFVLGKPPIDRLLIRFIPDSNTVVANLLSQTVDVSFNQTIGFPQAQALEQAGWNGKVSYRPHSPRIVEFQMRDWGQSQRASMDVRVRQAALHGIDRASIVDNIYAGKALVAHFWLPPSDPSFPAIDRVIRRYDYDPARAEALLRDAGWVKGGDGITRSAAGEALELPIQNQPNDYDQQEALVVVNNWKAVGITSEVHRLSPQETRDNELRATFPAVSYGRRAFTLEDMVWVSTQVPRADNRWTGQNRPGYVNPALEELWMKVLGTIDRRERDGLLVQALQLMMDDAVVTLTHLQPGVMASSADIAGPELPDLAVAAGALWNVGQWQLK